MGYAVEMFLRKDESRGIRRLFTTTRSVYASIDTTPHVSLAVFEDVDATRLAVIVQRYADRMRPFRIRFSSVGIFPGRENVVFLAPVLTETLLTAHTALHDQIRAEGLPCDGRYLPDAWVPHCAITGEELLTHSLETVRQIHEANVLGEYTIDNVNVVQFRPVVILASFPLCDAER